MRWRLSKGSGIRGGRRRGEEWDSVRWCWIAVGKKKLIGPAETVYEIGSSGGCGIVTRRTCIVLH